MAKLIPAFPNRTVQEGRAVGYTGSGDIEPLTPWNNLEKRAEAATPAVRRWLAERLAHGELKTAAQIKAAVKKLGLPEEHIEALKWDLSMLNAVRELVRARALYATIDALPHQAELAKTDVASYTAIAKTAEVLKSAGINLQQNTLIDRRNGGDDNGDQKFFENFQARSLRLVEGIKVHDPSTEGPPEPEETHVGDVPEEPDPEPEPSEEQ